MVTTPQPRQGCLRVAARVFPDAAYAPAGHSRSMRKPLTVIAAFTAALCVLPLSTNTATATTAVTATGGLALPAPTGPAAVGRTTLALTDHDRTDPWVPSAGA